MGESETLNPSFHGGAMTWRLKRLKALEACLIGQRVLEWTMNCAAVPLNQFSN
jgi:hypothetical protein